MNPAGLKMMGAKQESEICGLKYLNVPIPADRTRISELMERAKNGEELEFEFSAQGQQGPLHF